MKFWSSIFLLLIISIFHFNYAEDYYQIFGISRDATHAEIRRAFKKLALKHHPDKNKDDPKAHDKFTNINKVYEVLKDEELRKKYDLYGEEGLKDQQFGQQYQSWDYYNQEFGIYDNDPEITTLNYADFEQSVHGSNDVWFINFYSPYCSHCHDLAPAWREVARELDGVIRFGAINCNDDWSLCTNEGIRSYPSLKLYPKEQFYNGGRTTQKIVTFVLDTIDVRVEELTSGNFNHLTKDNNMAWLPWLISFCSQDEDCLSGDTKLKLAGMLAKLAIVSELNCDIQKKLCKQLGESSGVVFYPAGNVDKNNGKKIIQSLDAKDILKEVLKLLPEPTEINDSNFEDMTNAVTGQETEPWLLIFISGSSDNANSNLELRKLTALVPDVNIGSVDCSKSKSLCDKLYVRKHPIVGLFKMGGHEWHHGKLIVHDIAEFARESSTSNVKTLGPEDFPGLHEGSESWFIDFFAPWCPPCMKLLPEWRKAGRQIGKTIARFGTVDCTIHLQLCQHYNIRSYPTTVFYNQSVPHSFSGFHTMDDLIEIVRDTLNPLVVTLTPETFVDHIGGKLEGQTWLVDFYAPWCGPCRELTPIYRKLAKAVEGEATLGTIDCQQHRDFCQKEGVHSYPTIRLYPDHSTGPRKYIRHTGWRDLDSLYQWVFQNLPSDTIELDYYTFYQEVIASEKAWLIDFHTPWCGHCIQFAPTFERIGKRLDTIKTGKVNCETNYNLCQEAGVQSYPSLRFYAGSFSNSMSQPIHGIDIRSQDQETVIETVLNLLEEHIADKEADEERINRKKASRLPRDEF